MAHEPLAHLSNLYRLTLAQAYFNDRKMDRATFSLFTRSYSLNRGFSISAGLTLHRQGGAGLFTEAESLSNDFCGSWKDSASLRRWGIPEGQLLFFKMNDSGSQCRYH
jgi:hypothetical protein